MCRKSQVCRRSALCNANRPLGVSDHVMNKGGSNTTMPLPRKVHNYSIFIKLLFFSIRAESHGSFATGELHNVYELGQERTWTGYFYKVGCPERGNFVLWRLRSGLGLCGSSDLKLGVFSGRFDAGRGS